MIERRRIQAKRAFVEKVKDYLGSGIFSNDELLSIFEKKEVLSVAWLHTSIRKDKVQDKDPSLRISVHTYISEVINNRDLDSPSFCRSPKRSPGVEDEPKSPEFGAGLYRDVQEIQNEILAEKSNLQIDEEALRIGLN